MQYRQAVEYLNSFNKNHIKLGLERMQWLMSALGNPQDSLKFIHVGGTNGKGSIVNYLGNIMLESGEKVGMFTSPHLIKINESISINNCNIDNENFAIAVGDIEKAISGTPLEEELTTFEVLTAVALNYFYNARCTIVILEVGMGGQLDSTNIINSPIVSVIAKISLDHTEYLGKTIKEIAIAKAGIIKSGSMVVISPQEQREVVNIICDKCKELDIVPLIIADDYSDYRYENGRITWTAGGLTGMETTMLGRHQIANAMTAVGVARLMSVNDDCIKIAIATTRWQCRLELISDSPKIFIDGGHNIDGISAVVAFFKENYPKRKVKLIFGVLKDKQYNAMIKLLSTITQSVALVQVDSLRAVGIGELGAIFDGLDIKSRQYMDLYEAVEESMQNAERDDIILIIGSLYYVGKAREIVIKQLKEQL